MATRGVTQRPVTGWPQRATLDVMSDPMNWAVRDEPLGSRPAPVTDPAQAYPPAYGPPPTAPRRRRTGLIIALAAVAIVVGLGVAVGGYLALGDHLPGKANTIAVSGTLEVTGCTSLGYRDIHAGTQVIVTDERGTTLALGALEDVRPCEWRFRIAAVPAGKPFYGVSVGNRGTIQFTEAELRSGVQLTLN
jgi:hypothetical protein